MLVIKRQDYKKNKDIYNKFYNIFRNNLDKSVLIEHVGSTAIPNMYGKDIVDILIGVDNINLMEDVKMFLKDIGFLISESKNRDNYCFFASADRETTSGDVHIHLVINNSDKCLDFIMLRDYLLYNIEEASNYSEFKKKLFDNRNVNRREYKDIKSKYVSELIYKAREFFKRKGDEPYYG